MSISSDIQICTNFLMHIDLMMTDLLVPVRTPNLKIELRSWVIPSLVEGEAISEDPCLLDTGADAVMSVKSIP